MQTLKDVEENEVVSVREEDVKRLLHVWPECPHGYSTLDYCPNCLYIVAGLALSKLDKIESAAEDE